jgi:signal transduction histidine kinase
MNKIILILLSNYYSYSNEISLKESHYFLFLNIKDSANLYFKKALLYDNKNKHDLALKNYLLAKKKYINTNNLDSVAECNFQIFTLLSSTQNITINSKEYFDEFENYIKKVEDTLNMIKLYKQYATKFLKKNQNIKASNYFKKILLLSKLSKNREIEANTYSNLGLLYTNYKIDSASYFFDRALKTYNKNLTTEIFSTHLNYGNFYQKKGDLKKAIEEFKIAEGIKPKRYSLNLRRILYLKLANCYKEISNFKQAYFYFDKYNILRDSLKNKEQNIAISEIKEKYDNEILKAKNQKIEAKRKQNLNLLIISVLFIVAGSFIYILSLKNSKRKRKLAEQEKEIEQQKNLRLLKEQEISTINAIIDGQEKERLRIAEDLHDNIGSVLSTLKLHFENLKLNRNKKHFNQEELYEKTEKLIDETYLKVRKIAHAKNSGVIAHHGLLVAVKNMADKISSADNIKIEVTEFGLDKRIENNMEITIFRIIQELITNVIKHANATNVFINISLFDNSLNVIVEDNGKGFEKKILTSKNSMGLSSIKKRVKHLNGTLQIDSFINKGTTIIIDIPA